MSPNSPKQWFKLEEQFFNNVDQQLLAKLRGEVQTAETAETIMRVTGITDAELAQEIAAINITIDTLAAFRLVPLVAVAWADDRVEENERDAICLAAEKSGIAADEPAMELLKVWTRQRPGPELLDTWCEYSKALCSGLEESHRTKLKEEILSQVKAVAQASGGVIGFGSISAHEKEVIARVEAALA
ncbi:hypothetical protein [Aureliella helgolandensis]|uniref:Tellurite resistance protein TerB n=1 Tax=Aureliella helgolandensis TaxID=2527968 RepID=A0A518GCK2_9BACT|nr:hypothetical protein [Aureliella helgolandensis]QDV26326.1 hypothetical protein Q31a_46980 [Aureliella helgolandensis]